MYVDNLPDFAGCRLENDRQWDITWGNTLYGEVDVQRCPAGNGQCPS